MGYRIRATGSTWGLHAEIGPVGADGKFEFGMTAEVRVDAGRYGDSSIQPAEVSFAAIGSHSPATALRRMYSYAAAVGFAERVDREVAEGLTLEVIVEAYTDVEVGEVRWT